eukprot:gene1815-2149_t
MDSPDCMEVEDQEAVELLFNLAQVAPASTPAAGNHTSKRHKSLHGPKPLNKEAKETATGKRRGPMDDMRQLLRITLKLFPASSQILKDVQRRRRAFLGVTEANVQDIQEFFERLLSHEAPRPEWGVPQGYAVYLAGLISWVTDRPLAADQIERCLCRQGGAWKVINHELLALGLDTFCWPLPLDKQPGASHQLHCGGYPADVFDSDAAAVVAAAAAALGSTVTEPETEAPFGSALLGQDASGQHQLQTGSFYTDVLPAASDLSYERNPWQQPQEGMSDVTTDPGTGAAVAASPSRDATESCLFYSNKDGATSEGTPPVWQVVGPEKKWPMKASKQLPS